MKIGAAQIACKLGDLSANLRTLRDFAERAKAAGAELVVFPAAFELMFAVGCKWAIRCRCRARAVFEVNNRTREGFMTSRRTSESLATD